MIEGKNKNLKALDLNKKNLKAFLDDLRKEDKKELEIFFKTNTLEDFFSLCFKNKKTTYFLENKNNIPVALGGVVSKENKGLIWLLCTNEAKYHKKELYGIIKTKISDFKKEYPYLYNYIYKTNFKALLWLKKLGFKYKKVNENFKYFYFERS